MNGDISMREAEQAPDDGVVIAAVPHRGALWSGVGPVVVAPLKAKTWRGLAVSVRASAKLRRDGGALLPGDPVPWLASGEHTNLGAMPEGALFLSPRKGCDLGLRGKLRVPMAIEHALDVRVAPRGESMDNPSFRRRLALRRGTQADPVALIELGPSAVFDPTSGAPIEPRLPRDLTPTFVEDDEALAIALDWEPGRGLVAPWLKPGDAVLLQVTSPESGGHSGATSDVLAWFSLGFAVAARLDYLDGSRANVEMRCDWLEVDLDDDTVAMIFRGIALDSELGVGLERVAVCALPEASAGAASFSRELPRAQFRHAPSLTERGRAPILSGSALMVARYSTWDADEEPELLMPFDEAMEVARAVAEEGSAALERFGLDPYEWRVEERALLARIADPERMGAMIDNAVNEESRPLTEFSSGPERPAATSSNDGPRLSIEAFAALSARVAVGLGASALAAARLTLADFAREEAAWERSCEEDESLARALDALLRLEREHAARELAAVLERLTQRGAER
ncbi:MAG: hypothetical protein U0271_06650 [Polyangiaceae bacterium]